MLGRLITVSLMFLRTSTPVPINPTPLPTSASIAVADSRTFSYLPTLTESHFVNEKATLSTFCPVPVRTIEPFKFNKEQAYLLHRLTGDLVLRWYDPEAYGPQASRAAAFAKYAADQLKRSFSPEQLKQLKDYENGLIPALAFEDMLSVCGWHDDRPSEFQELPNLPILTSRYTVAYLGSRSQIALALVNQSAFAYDIDNDGQIVRLVANFKGGGREKLEHEPEKAELSSHAGVTLGLHTEGPYHSVGKPRDGHSPAPASLILTALENPAKQPTLVIPLAPILEKIGPDAVEVLSGPYFNFSPTDSYSSGEGAKGVPIIYPGGKVCYNSYRSYVDENAPSHVKEAFAAFTQEVEKATLHPYVLTQNSVLLINNWSALHARDILESNYRVLIRLFGAGEKDEHIVVSPNPLVVQG